MSYRIVPIVNFGPARERDETKTEEQLGTIIVDGLTTVDLRG